MSSPPRSKNSEPGPSAVETIAWFCMAVSVLGTLWYMMHEPEEGIPTTLSPAMARARSAAIVAALVGAIPGVWHILTRGGSRNLFAMAVLFNVILASFWILRLVARAALAGG